MEFALALFGAVAKVAVAKLGTVMERLSIETSEMRFNARSIKEELECIGSFTRDTYTDRSGHASFLQETCIAQLRCLAYDIEDCIDSFEANMLTPEQFGTQLGDLKVRSKDTKKRIKSYLVLEQGRGGRTQQWADAGAAVVPRELPDLLDDPTRQALLGENLDCLLYFCLFPHEHDVNTKSLMRRWLAEGLVEAEQVAIKNLDKLIKSTVISSTQTSNNGDVETCRPSAEMLQCISKRSRSQNFILVCDSTAQPQGGKARRLTVHRSANAQLNLPRNLSHHRLGTLAVFRTDITATATAGAPVALARDEAVLDFSRYEVLRVLDLKESDPLSEDHLNAIYNQVLMKYLSINLGSIDRIPRAIGHLNQLETLDLSGSKIVTVFKEVLLLPELKHLLGKFQLSKSDMFSVPVLGLFGSGLEKFLRDKSKLETLAGFVTSERYGFPQLMSLMRRLHKVKIWFEPNASKKHLSDTSSAITKFIHVGSDEPDLNRSLSIDFQACSGELVNRIKPDHGKLDSLKLRGKLNGFPPFVAGLNVIVELCLWSTDLSWEVILVGLSNMKGLKYLKLVEEKLGHIEIQPQHLKSLVRICIVVSETTLDMAIQADALPHLVSLHMLCEDLHVTPGTTGIEITHMKKLKEVMLHHKVADGIRSQWQKAVDGHTNTPLPILLPIQGP